MEKIKTVFKINRDTGLAENAIVPESSWYQDADSIATLKIDGRAFAVINQKPYVRYDRKIQDKYRHLVGKEEIQEYMLKPIPENGIACEETFDKKTGHHPFWVPPSEAWIIETFEEENKASPLSDGTYELIGPKVRCNVYGKAKHELVKHGSVVLDIPDRSYSGIKEFLANHPEIEGIVFQKQNGSTTVYAKVRQKDFGLEWNSAAEGIRAKRK